MWGGSKCLLALTCVCNRHQLCSFPLANFVCATFSPQCITSISHAIELGSAVVVLGLEFLEDVKVGITLIRSIVKYLWICEALPGVGHRGSLPPGMKI